MRKTIFIVFIAFLFISCATTRTEESVNNDNIGVIYCCEDPDVKLAAVYGKNKTAGQIQLYEIEIRKKPEYYVCNNEKTKAIRYIVNDKKELLKDKSIQVKNIEGQISFMIPGKEKQKSAILINLDSKMIQQNSNSNLFSNYIGTWIDDSNSESKRKYTFKSDKIFIDENEKEDEFYLHYNRYTIFQETFLIVEKWTKSLLSDKETVEFLCFYFDGKNLYDLIFPLKDISDNKEIQKVIRNAKEKK